MVQLEKNKKSSCCWEIFWALAHQTSNPICWLKA